LGRFIEFAFPDRLVIEKPGSAGYTVGIYKFAPHLSSLDSGETGQKVVGAGNTVEQAPGKGQDASLE
jgi:hypothetical protein